MMESIGQVLSFVATQIFGSSSFFMGLIVLIGSILLKKSGKDTLVSTIRAMVGMLILSFGSQQLTATSSSLLEIFTLRLGVQGVCTDPWAANEIFTQELATIGMGNVSMVMICGWLLNLALARFTRLKTIHLTGHIALLSAALITYFLWQGFGLVGMPLFLVSVLVCGLYWWLAPSLLRPFLKPLLGDTQLSLGHEICLTSILTIKLGKWTGGGSKSAEEVQLPAWLSVFKDSVVSYSLIMSGIYLIIIFMAGEQIVAPFSGDTNWIIWGVLQGLEMAAGCYVLLAGVKMFLDELMQAFEGFSKKLVPGAIAAVDTPVFWNFAPTAAMLGFMATLIGQFGGVALLILFGSPVVAIPSVAPLFFSGCTIGVFANSTGGWRGLMIATTIIGVLTILGSAALAYLLQATYVPGFADWSTFWAPILGLFQWIS